jgi:hypothetical protein
MKKILAALLVLGFILTASQTFAASATATATWQQTLPSPVSVFGGWEVWVSDTQNGTYTLLATVPYVSTQTTYTTNQTITVSDGIATTKWFKMLAYNKSGKKSGFTPSVSATIDLEAAPSVPITLTITITVQ